MLLEDGWHGTTRTDSHSPLDPVGQLSFCMGLSEWNCRIGLDWREGLQHRRALVTGFNYHSLDEEHLEVDQNLNEVDNRHSYYEPFIPNLYWIFFPNYPTHLFDLDHLRNKCTWCSYRVGTVCNLLAGPDFTTSPLSYCLHPKKEMECCPTTPYARNQIWRVRHYPFPFYQLAHRNTYTC